MRRGFAPGFVNYKKGRTRIATASDKVACPWSVVSPGTTATSTIISCRHDIAEILLKVALNTKDQNHSNHTIIS